MYHFAICSPPPPLFLPSFGLFRLITSLFHFNSHIAFLAKTLCHVILVAVLGFF